MADSIQGASDTELLAMAFQFHQAIVGSPAVYALTAAQATTLGTQRGAFSDALDFHNSSRATALSATQAKGTERTTLEDLLRSYKNIAKAAGTDAALMAALGLPSSSQPSPENATVPLATVDTSVRLRHTIHFADVAGNGNKRKPRGVIGCEIWLKLEGTPPTDETQ